MIRIIIEFCLNHHIATEKNSVSIILSQNLTWLFSGP